MCMYVCAYVYKGVSVGKKFEARPVAVMRMYAYMYICVYVRKSVSNNRLKREACSRYVYVYMYACMNTHMYRYAFKAR